MRCSEYSDGNEIRSSIDTQFDGDGLVGWGMALPGVRVDSSLLTSEDVISVVRPRGMAASVEIKAITHAQLDCHGEEVVLTRDACRQDDGRQLVFLRNIAAHNMTIAVMNDFDHLARVEYEMHVERVFSTSKKVFAGSESALALVVMAPGDKVVLRTYLEHTPRHKSWFTRIKPKMLLTTRTLENEGGDIRLTEQGWNPDLGNKPLTIRQSLLSTLRNLGYQGSIPVV